MHNEFLIKPKKYPLNIILIGTTILAVPAAFGTFALLDNSSSGTPDGYIAEILLLTSIIGFLLFAGYILTAIFQKHTSILWFCSTLYNLALCCAYAAIFFGLYTQSGISFPIFCYNVLTSGSWLLPAWTTFVTGASAYYLKHVLRPTKINLP